MSPPSCPYDPRGHNDARLLHPTRQPCPTSAAQREFDRIYEAYPSLASTGCTAKFCHSGRMKHTDEERVGRNQAVEKVAQDAADFLRQLRQAGIIKTDMALCERMRQVRTEIRLRSVCARYAAREGAGSDLCQSQVIGIVGGTWTQTSEELEFGIRVAWKNARRCIMRSDYRDLKLCDLRHIKTSKEMATKLINHLEEAFNGGDIRPTVFVFPPRNPSERGPMIWNGQLLSFAGYVQEDGAILGDPVNVELTKAIIELGWRPPAIRTRWDLLPLVTMAEGDEPIITEIPKDAFPLVKIQHPRYDLAFEKLGLRWVPAPALSRLGFSIGGVQYTATPFIVWFMDAEIGVRNLADSFRYNVLPQVVRKMGLCEQDLDDLPEFERLALLSRAQLELNYAVSWSFAKVRVRMIDSLSASELFTRFDDEHLAEHGYRLPSDPYWLAPPQGSIIPTWHRGASPNYQPNPMICHHVQDPIKAWRRESRRPDINTATHPELNIPINAKLNINLSITTVPRLPQRRVYIAYCSSDTVAHKLCRKLLTLLRKLFSQYQTFSVMPVQTLNLLTKSKLRPEDVLIIVASNTRTGEMPQNGRDFHVRLSSESFSFGGSFSVFGNGSSDYANTFNQTTRDLTILLIRRGGRQLCETLEADTVVQNPPWTAFYEYYRLLSRALLGAASVDPGTISLSTHTFTKQKDLVDTTVWFRSRISSIEPNNSTDISHTGLHRVSLDIQDRTYPPMCYLSILTPNPPHEVQKLIRSLNISPRERLHFAQGLTIEDFLRFHADLDRPFLDTRWILEARPKLRCSLEDFATLPLREAIPCLPSNWRYWASLEGLCRAVPQAYPRKYSVASDMAYASSETGQGGRDLDLLAQHHEGGRFSDVYLNRGDVTSGVMCKIERVPHLEPIAEDPSHPLILFATGSGMAPIRSLLQHRMHLLLQISSLPSSSTWEQPGSRRRETHITHAPITLIVGYKDQDETLIEECINKPRKLGLFDILEMVPRSKEKGKRAQDAVFRDGIRENVVEKLRGDGRVFVCARAEAEEDFAGNLSALLGCDVRVALGEKYVADVYQPAV
ncbi:nitric oxide synthase [Xylariomycetidae sp. FL2044]|nr:nitric oxide synthase [Xylariomycetidae sp. FL2044]